MKQKRRKCKATPVVEIHPARLDDDRSIECRIVWTGVKLDRPSTHSIMLDAKKKTLALRFRRAVAAGAVYKNPCIVKDIFDKTYIVCEGVVLARHLNAELQRLGY